MSNRMKTGIFISIAVFLLGIFLLRFAVPQTNFTQEEVTDETLVKELEDRAEVSIKDYFGIEIDKSRPWETNVVLNTFKDDDKAIPVYVVMKKDSTENLEEGTVTSYGVIMTKDTKEIVGAIYMPVSNGPAKEMTDQEIENKSTSFLQDKKISAEKEELKVVQIERDEKSGNVRVIVEGQDMVYCVIYNLRTDAVTYFEKTKIVSQAEQ